jgi:hypothetical protein
VTSQTRPVGPSRINRGPRAPEASSREPKVRGSAAPHHPQQGGGAIAGFLPAGSPADGRERVGLVEFDDVDVVAREACRIGRCMQHQTAREMAGVAAVAPEDTQDVGLERGERHWCNPCAARQARRSPYSRRCFTTERTSSTFRMSGSDCQNQKHSGNSSTSLLARSASSGETALEEPDPASDTVVPSLTATEYRRRQARQAVRGEDHPLFGGGLLSRMPRLRPARRGDERYDS